MTTPAALKNYIGGAWIEVAEAAAQDSYAAVTNPATGVSLARVPLSGQGDVDRAVTVARDAFDTWRRVPPAHRARYLFRYKNLLEASAEELARTITSENGKTLDESRGEVRLAIENVEHACGVPSLMMGESLEDVSAGIDCHTLRQPIGVFAAITPFSFPAMVPTWFWPIALATGNTVIVKPSEKTPLSQALMFELAHEAGFPSGVLNLVHGDGAAADALAAHPGVDGVSFVGSTEVARKTYERATTAGKRAQAFGGAKNHMVVMPDAHLARTAATLVESAFGCAGQRCLGAGAVIAVGKIYDALVAKVVDAASALVLGNGAEPGVHMGPVSSAEVRDQIAARIGAALAEGAKLVLDGRAAEVCGGAAEKGAGHFIGPTILADVSGDMAIATDEMHGPIMVIRRAADLSEAIALVRKSRYGNATSVFTQSGKTAREFRYKAGVSMIGINIGVPAPRAYFPFGGTKDSFFGDTKAHGKDAIGFFTDQKVVISRWF